MAFHADPGLVAACRVSHQRNVRTSVMTSIPQEASSPARRRRAIEPILLAARIHRHHGVWTPGVKLMRNQDLKTKAAICLGLGLIVLGLPLQESIRERWHAWQHMRVAQDGLAQTIEMGRLGWSLGDLSDALLNETLWAACSSLDPILEKKTAYEQLIKLTEGADVPIPTKRAAAGLTDARSAFLSRLREVATQPGTASPRVEALTAYRHQLQTLRLAVAPPGATASIPTPSTGNCARASWTSSPMRRSCCATCSAWACNSTRASNRPSSCKCSAPRSLKRACWFNKPNPTWKWPWTTVCWKKRHRRASPQQRQPVHSNGGLSGTQRRHGADPEGLAIGSVPASVFLKHAQQAMTQDFALLKEGHVQLSERIQAQRNAQIHSLLRDAGW